MKSAGPILRFGPFEFDRDRRRLSRGTTRVRISDRHMAMLAELVSNANAVVLKNRLASAAWPEAAVADNNIVQAIKALRAALKSRPNGPVFIETIIGRGYRLNTEVTAGPASRPAAQLEPLLAPHAGFVSGRIALETLDRNRIAVASRDLEAALVDHPDVPTTHVALANVDFLLFDSTRIDATPDLARLEKARAHANRGCELSPHSGDAWGILGLTRHRSGDILGGLAAARKAIDLEPTPFLHYVRLAMVSWGDERLVATDRALKRCPELAFAHWVAATVCVARGSFDLALERLRVGCALQDAQGQSKGRFGTVGCHWLHALVLAATGDIDEALRELIRERRSVDPQHVYARESIANSWYATGALMRRIGQHDKAIAAFKDALKVVPEHTLATLAMTLIGKEDGISGKNQSGHDNSVQHAIGQAIVLTSLGQHAAAARRCLEALEQAPQGSAGWILPVEPMLNVTARPDVWAPVLTLVARRAL